jgi:orotidine-5'-phosphate decarboxylase
MDRARDRLIVALDVPTAAEAQRIVAALGEAVSTYKVGKQLFTAAGPAVVRELTGSGRRVFLDLKYHDIPSTVAAAVRAASELGVSMLTVHASGGLKMLEAAAEAASAAKNPSLVLAVTVLTSMVAADLKEIGVAGRPEEQVLRLARLARQAGCGGVVASAQEARTIRRELGTGFAIVTPGVRPAGWSRDDQARVATPAEALAAGATHIVVGRPITGAKDPKAAAKAILEEMAASIPSAQPGTAVPHNR